MLTVKQILQAKGAAVARIAPDRTIGDALDLMTRENVGALVVARGDQLVGMFSERDLARKIDRAEGYPLALPVGSMMTSRVCYVGPAQTVEECMALVTHQRCRHLPVLEDGKLVGLVSIGDLVKATIAEKDFEIGQLVSYIREAV